MTPDPKATGGCWPTPTQELLLRAALIDGEKAVELWQQWHQQTDIENLDSSSSRLLPLLLCNLEKQGVPRSHLTRYKSVSRYYWLKNQLLFEQAKHLVLLLEDNGIPTLILNGGAIIPLYYPKSPARPMDDFDILVPSREASRAFDLLLANDYRLKVWKSAVAPSEQFYSVLHAHTFYYQQDPRSAKHNFDVHQHVFPQSFTPDADDEFWDAAVPFEFEGISSRALCPEDMLLHMCAHGVYWADVPPLRWIADATLILRATPEFDWNRLVAQTKRLGLSGPVHQALKYLHRLDLDISVSPDAIRQLAAIPTSRAQRREWRVFTRPRASHSLALKFWLRTRAYARWNAANPAWKRPFTFPRYMQFLWGFDSFSKVPSYGLKRFYSIARSKISGKG
ncbi:hypothetical protein EON83_19195 [bacterium]|nr:MAG: hypothetical protein EON83_19195 [bacterium]